LFYPRLDLFFLVDQLAPSLAVTVGPVRTHLPYHLADRLLGELCLAPRAIDSELDRGGDVAPDGFAINPDPSGDGAVALTSHPAPKRFFDLYHRYLPERHGACFVCAWKALSTLSSTPGSECSRWSHNWQRRVPCRWQMTVPPRRSRRADRVRRATALRPRCGCQEPVPSQVASGARARGRSRSQVAVAPPVVP